MSMLSFYLFFLFLSPLGIPFSILSTLLLLLVFFFSSAFWRHMDVQWESAYISYYIIYTRIFIKEMREKVDILLSLSAHIMYVRT